MTSITKSGMTTNSFSYNGLDTRIGLTDSSGTKTFKRAGVGVVAPVLSDDTANFTPSGEKRGSTKTTFHSALKNSDIQTNSSGSVSASKQFDAFGNEIGSSGTWKSQYAYAGGFGYQQDSDTGLKLLGHRYYDSDTGRFLTRDVAKDGRNWYSYCDNNPVSYVDAEGLAKIWVAWRPVKGTGMYHALIIIKDEKTGAIYVIEGGPNWVSGKLEGGGRWITDGDEYNEIMGTSTKKGYKRVLLVDDDKSAFYWVGKYLKNPPSHNVKYEPMPYASGQGNSNSYVREVLERMGLRTRQPSSLLPGWVWDPWGDPSPTAHWGGNRHANANSFWKVQ